MEINSCPEAAQKAYLQNQEIIFKNLLSTPMISKHQNRRWIPWSPFQALNLINKTHSMVPSQEASSQQMTTFRASQRRREVHSNRRSRSIRDIQRKANHLHLLAIPSSHLTKVTTIRSRLRGSKWWIRGIQQIRPCWVTRRYRETTPVASRTKCYRARQMPKPDSALRGPPRPRPSTTWNWRQHKTSRWSWRIQQNRPMRGPLRTLAPSMPPRMQSKTPTIEEVFRRGSQNCRRNLRIFTQRTSTSQNSRPSTWRPTQQVRLLLSTSWWTTTTFEMSNRSC